MTNTKPKGYTVTFQPAQRLLRLRFWGFWDIPTADAMNREFRDTMTQAAPDGPWYVLADIAEFPPQSADVQAILARTMQFAREHGMQKAARIVSSTITKMQIARLSNEQHLPENSFFYDEAEALRWLLSNN